MSDVVLYEVADGVATITLNRPGQRNAVNAELGQALNEALVRAAKDPSIRALIITGAGEGFCAGADFDRLRDVVEKPGPSAAGPDPIFAVYPDTPPEYLSRYSFARALPFPVIAAVNGVAVGAGLALAASADFRLASPRAAFLGGFVRIGTVAEMALAWTLTHLIGQGPARDMLLSGRRIDAEEALRFGLVTRLFAAETLLAETQDRKSTRLNSSHMPKSRMPSSA